MPDCKAEGKQGCFTAERIGSVGPVLSVVFCFNKNEFFGKESEKAWYIFGYFAIIVTKQKCGKRGTCLGVCRSSFFIVHRGRRR